MGSGAADTCAGCVEPPSNATIHASACRKGSEQSSPIDATSAVYFCADAWASQICSKAKSNEKLPRPYRKFNNFLSCNCPVSTLFKIAYLPNETRYNFERNLSSCDFTEQHTYQTRLPQLKPEDIRRNRKAWCGEPPVVKQENCLPCKMLPECMDSPPEECAEPLPEEVAFV